MSTGVTGPSEAFACKPPEVAGCGALLQYIPDLAFDLGPAIAFNAATIMTRNVQESTSAADVGLLPLRLVDSRLAEN